MPMAKPQGELAEGQERAAWAAAKGQFICPGAKQIKGAPGLWNTDWGFKGHADNPYNNRCDELAVAQWQRRKG